MVAVGVPPAFHVRGLAPGDGALCIKKFPSSNGARGHFLEVVGRNEFAGHELLVLQHSSISVNSHFVEVGESRLPDESLVDLIDARRGNPHLHPFPGGEHRILGVSFGVGGYLPPGHAPHIRNLWPGFHREHETDEPLVFPAPMGDGYETHLKAALLPFNHHVDFGDGHFRHGVVGDLAHLPDAVIGHLHPFRVEDVYGVGGVGIISLERYGARKPWKHGVDAHLLGGEVMELLCGRVCHDRQQEANHNHHLGGLLHPP